MFHGSIVALVTPMSQDGAIDYAALAVLVDFHLAHQTDALVILGTTGESPTVKPDEARQMIEQVIKQVNGKIPVIIGTGTNDTFSTIAKTRMALELGADAALVVTPYYNKPTQAGLIAHYTVLANATPLPIILYNVPGRTGCDLLPEAVATLAKLPTVVGIKEGSGNVPRTQELIRAAGNTLCVYSGDDASALESFKLGAKGVISVTANVAPSQMHAMCAAALARDWDLAESINSTMLELHQALFLESNPIPSKWALQEMGLIGSGIRLPLTPFSSQYHAALKAAMVQAGCFN